MTYKIKDAKVAAIKNYRLNTNWKLVAENFQECYHCGGAHPEYCSAVIGANLREDTNELTNAKQKGWNEKGLETKLIEVTEGTTTICHTVIRCDLVWKVIVWMERKFLYLWACIKIMTQVWSGW
jgi:phenylpropionate dioxygenase-like ring-hydroxylating dioxygenase large terminal subunit